MCFITMVLGFMIFFISIQFKYIQFNLIQINLIQFNFILVYLKTKYKDLCQFSIISGLEVFFHHGLVPISIVYLVTPFLFDSNQIHSIPINFDLSSL